MSRTAILLLACLLLVAVAPAAAAVKKYDCTPDAQTISPDGMGVLNTVEVFEGSTIQLDGAQWRDAVTGEIPAVGFPGESVANVTSGSHILRVTLPEYQDFVANVTICDRGTTYVEVRQVPVRTTPAGTGKPYPGESPAAAGTVPASAPTKTPGFCPAATVTAVLFLWMAKKVS